MNRYCIILIILGIFSYGSGKSDTKFDSLYHLAKTNNSVHLANLALTQALENDNPLQIAKTYYLLGLRKKQRSMYYGALQSYFDALNYYRTLKDITWQCNTLWNIGIIYSEAGFINESIKVYLDALDLAQSIDNSSLVADLHYQLGLAHRLIKVYDQAHYFLDLAEQHERTENDRIGLYQIKLERWAISTEQQDYATIKANAIDASQIEELPLNYQMRYWNNLGNTLFLTNELDSAESILNMALGRKDTTQVERDIIAEICRNLALILEKKNEVARSLEMYKWALTYYNPRKSNIKYLKVADILYNAYQDSNLIIAKTYHDKIVKYSEGMTILYDQVEKAHFQYQVQAAVYKRESDQRKQALAEERRLFFTGLAAFVLIGIAIFGFYRYDSRKKKLAVKKVVDDIDALLDIKRVS